jgi:hypothetical protein
MCSRTFRRFACLVLLSSLGALSVPGAEAAPVRGRTALIQTGPSIRNFVYNMMDLLRSLSVNKDDPPPPNNPGDDPPHTGNREGSSGCPVGRPPGPPPGR